MSKLTTRALDPMQDSEGLIDLFETVFGFTVTPQMWAWKYLPPWTKRHYCYVAYDGDRVIGYFGAVPQRGQVRGQEIPFFQFADFMVHPQYRRKHDYFDLGLTHVLEDITQGPHLVYGFSDHRAFLWFKRLGLSQLVEKAVTRYVRPGKRASGAFEFRDWDLAGSEVDLVWEQQASHCEIGLIRDAQYFGWRYGHHPANSYRLLGVYILGDPVGCIVLGNDGAGQNGRPAEIPVVDALLPDEILLPALQSYCDESRSSLMIWLPEHRSRSFPEAKESGTHVYHFTKNSSFSTEELKKGLYYTMGDVDWW